MRKRKKEKREEWWVTQEEKNEQEKKNCQEKSRTSNQLSKEEVRPTQAAPLKKESVYLKVKITSEASSHHSG